MASVWREKGNPIWRAKVKLPSGKITSRSTKETNKAKAQKIADLLQAQFDKMSKGATTEKVLLKAIRSAAIDSGLGDINIPTIKETFDTYLGSIGAIKRKDSTLKKYKTVVTSLLDYLGKERCAQSINTLRTVDIENWRNKRIKDGITGSTADNQLSIISFELGSSKRKGIIAENPAEGIEFTGEGAEKRQQFTSSEIVKLFNGANNEWRGMILLGLWYGMRIGDSSNIKWDQISLNKRTITHTPSKTGRRNKQEMVYTMPDEVHDYIKQASKKKRSPYLFPSLAGKSSGSFGGLSNAFGRIMNEAGIVVPKGIKKEGIGRQFRKKGYHALKYSQASRMAEAGIPEHLAKAISMHSSSPVHQGYVQYTQELQRALFAKLPSLFKRGKEKTVKISKKTTKNEQ